MLPDISKALTSLKPAETRLQNWRQVLLSVFEWEELSLSKFKEDNPWISEYVALKELPLTVDNISKLKEIEDKIKECKRLSKQKETERKEILSPVETMKTRLMVTEKAYATLAAELEPVYIKLKKIQTAESEKIEFRNREIANFRTQMKLKFSESENAWNLYNQSKVTEVYRDALDLIEPEDLKVYLDDILSQHCESEFGYALPYGGDDAEKIKIWKEVFSFWDAKRLCSEFKTLLEQTFVGFEQAKKQASEAILIRESEEKIETLQIEETAEMEEHLIVLEEKATPVVYEEPVKTRDIKVVYAIDMEHSFANMKKIDKAFYSNIDNCMAVWQGKDCWNIDTNTRGDLLCKLKNKDVNFQPDGVVFKEIEKI